MELSKSDRIDLLFQITSNKKCDFTEEDYSFYFKKDEWSEIEVIRLFTTHPENVRHLYSLIESSRKAGKLNSSRYDCPFPPPNDQEYIYYYEPSLITNWAIGKEIPLPNIVIEWYEKVNLKQADAIRIDSDQTNQDKKSEEKPQNETERQKMLMLILGMAIDGYGYDRNSENRQTVTGENKNSISARIRTRGITVSSDTILKYLTEAKNIL